MIRRRGYIIFGIIFSFMSFFAVAGCMLAKDGNIVWTGKRTAYIFLPALFAGILLGIGITEIMLLLSKIINRNSHKEPAKEILSDRQILILSFCGIFLAWLPFFLAFYPGNCTYDIGGQTWYIVSHHYEAHHPLLHTLIMEFFLRIGISLKNANLGMAMYVLFQMSYLAFSFALGMRFLHKLKVARGWLIFLQLWAMFFSPNAYLAVSTTKDIFFAAEVLLMTLCLYGALLRKRNSLKPDKYDYGFVIHAVLMICFRNNGKYALMVLLVVLACAALKTRENRKFYGRIAIMSLSALIAGSFILSALSYLLKAEDIRKEEMLSVPIQQLSRVMYYHGDEMEKNDKELIDGFFTEESYRNYVPSISDPVKSSVDLVYLRNHLSDFVKLYIKLLIRYPDEYVNAVLALDAGYLNLFDRTHEDVYTWGASYIRVGWSPNKELGLYQDSKSIKLYNTFKDFADKNSYDKIPVIRYLIMPGTYLWLFLFLGGWLLWQRKLDKLCVLAFPAGYYLTLFLGPTVQLRYLYAIMVILPFMYAVMMSNGFYKHNGGKSDHAEVQE